MAKAKRHVEDLRGIREAASQSPVTEDASLTAREETWTLKYRDPTGREHSAQVVSRIMTGEERTRVDRTAGIMAGCTWSNLPPGSQARFVALAQVAIQLREPPDWVERWVMEDNALLFSLFAKLQEHESFFFRGNENEGETDSGFSRVELT